MNCTFNGNDEAPHRDPIEILRKLRPMLPETAEFISLDQPDIITRIRQGPPFLVIQKAWLSTDSNSPPILLAQIRFPVGTCDGHYPGAPTIPLVDMGRAMEQSAALLTVARIDLPKQFAVVSVERIRAETMEMADPDAMYWVLARYSETSSLITEIYSDLTGNLLASMTGWEYMQVSDQLDSGITVSSSLRAVRLGDEVTWGDALVDDEINSRIPQRGPFWIVREARIGKLSDGRWALRTCASISANMVTGHFVGRPVLGSLHLSRALAQSGMLLASLASGIHVAVPEVVSIKRIAFDWRDYLSADLKVETEVVCERTFTRGGRQFASVRGAVWVGGAARLETDQFTYVLIPRAEHPCRQLA